MYARASRILWRLAQTLVALAVAPYVANGQSLHDVGVRTGAPVRLYMRDAPICESSFVSADPSVLRVSDGCAFASEIPWQRLTRVDAFVPQAPSPARIAGGAAIGGASTLLLIVGVGLLTNELGTCEYGRGLCPLIGIAATAPALIGIGTGIGAIVGYRSRSRRWITVWP